MIRAVPHVAAMASYALADLGDAKIVSLAQNESAFPPSPKAVEAGQRAMDEAHLYPDPDWRVLRTALADIHPVAAETILCGAGSMELIGALIRAFTGPGDEVLGTDYGYLFVDTAAQQAGATYVTAPEPDYTVSVDEIMARVTPATRLVFVCNLGNPTGTAIPNAVLLSLRAALSDVVLLVIDQASAEFDHQDPSPVFEMVKDGKTVVTRTLSKAYGLAGARVGWGAFPPAIGDEVRKLLNPNNISGVTQAMAEAAVADQPYMALCVQETARRRNAFSERPGKAGYSIPPSATNFVLIPFADEPAAQRADVALRDAEFALRAMGGYGLPHTLRATVGSAEDMHAVAKILEELA